FFPHVRLLLGISFSLLRAGINFNPFILLGKLTYLLGIDFGEGQKRAIPFGNFLPAIAIVIISLGTIEKDGLVIAIGMIGAIFVLTLMASAIAMVFHVVFPGILPK
ncbi:exopolysaccharide biosynthesis protein, partial [Candidatus Gracilibacteria bacterium]|nr:exopolysaccharide biosynthesis protein [Candidatus Gracilibacteria bacterium]